MSEHIQIQSDWFLLLLFFMSHFQPISLPCSLVNHCLLHNLIFPSLSVCLTQACLSVWSQDSSRCTATVRLRTPVTCAVHLITDIIEIYATHTKTLLTQDKKMNSNSYRMNKCEFSLTATINMEADWGSGQAIHKVSSSTGLHIYTGAPPAAVVIEAGADGQSDDAFVGLRVAAVEPDGSVGATVILRDAEGGHGVPGHAGEAVPFSRHVAVTERHAGWLVDVVVCVPPGFIQADVGRAGVQGWVMWVRWQRWTTLSCTCLEKILNRV